MTLSRRGFLGRVGVGAVGTVVAPAITGRGLEALVGRAGGSLVGPLVAPAAPRPGVLRLDSNENPDGPSPAALKAIQDALFEVMRYPDEAVTLLQAAIAKSHGTDPYHVRVACGSTDVLCACVRAFTSSAHGLVTAAPTYETPAEQATLVGAPVKAVRVTSDLTLDLDAMAAAAKGAGLVYVCNPNNPTSTVHGGQNIRSFLARIARLSPDTTVLIDEAYHEYVDDPGYETAAPLALEDPRVIVARTFSKVHGMAGLRVGYALGRPATMNVLEKHLLELGVNALGAAAAMASIGGKAHIEREQARNRAARDYTLKALADMGLSPAPSETNFVMVDVKRDAREFRAACRDKGLLIGRPFPPLATHARITIGTLAEMKRAMPIVKGLLG